MRRVRCAAHAAVVVVCALLTTVPPAGAQNATAGGVLARRVTISVTNAPIAEALMLLRRDMRVPLAWSGDIIPADSRITITLRDVPLEGTLEALLSGSGLGYVVTPQGTVVIVPRPAAAVRAFGAAADSAAVARALAATGVRQLDAVIVMGTPVAARPEREQPTAVSVVHAAELDAAGHGSLSDVMRTLLPGVVLWDRGPLGPPAPIASVRGVSSFTTRALKTYVDGIELASPELFTLVDARTIERIEVIRGPQGAALYGPDALNGILQVTTRHGRIGTNGVLLRGSASAGRYDRADLADGEGGHDVAAGIEGAGAAAAADLGGAYSRLGGNDPLARAWNVNGGIRALWGPVILDASARIALREYAADSLLITGDSDPHAHTLRNNEERAVAFTAVHMVASRWRQTLVAGHHWISGAREPFRSPLLPPRLPGGATDETASRTSVRYSSEIDLTSATVLSIGAEHSRRDVERSVRRTADVLAFPAASSTATGAFAQGRVHIGPVIFSGGTRGERLSTVDPGVGLVWASTAGASWTHPLPVATLRLRAAWGNGIRPPEPGMNDAIARGDVRQEANPDLAPERQRGVEAGADVYFANGAVLRATWYDQHAIDLIQQVQFRAIDTATFTYQFQNVGAVRNNGLELEAVWRWQQWTANALAYFPRSEVRRLSRSYTGELRAGDRLIEVPDAAGAGSVRYDGGRWHAESGVSWLGGWLGYDWRVIARIEHGLATRRPTVRDYWRDYRPVARPYAAVSMDVAWGLRAFVRADNPWNAASIIRDNRSPRLGRMVTVGVRTTTKSERRN